MEFKKQKQLATPPKLRAASTLVPLSFQSAVPEPFYLHPPTTTPSRQPAAAAGNKAAQLPEIVRLVNTHMESAGSAIKLQGCGNAKDGLRARSPSAEWNSATKEGIWQVNQTDHGTVTAGCRVDGSGEFYKGDSPRHFKGRK